MRRRERSLPAAYFLLPFFGLFYWQQVPWSPSWKLAHSVAPQLATLGSWQPTWMVCRAQYCWSGQWWAQLVTLHWMLVLAFLLSILVSSLWMIPAPAGAVRQG
jgi:hypothetical protein